jgi:hypothetical protein
MRKRGVVSLLGKYTLSLVGKTGSSAPALWQCSPMHGGCNRRGYSEGDLGHGLAATARCHWLSYTVWKALATSSYYDPRLLTTDV